MMEEIRALEKASTLVNSIMNNPGILELPARGETDNHLERIGDSDRWKLCTQYENTRIGFTDEGEIEFCDPVDGPYISLGYIVGPYQVEKIEVEDGIILTLEDGRDSSELE